MIWFCGFGLVSAWMILCWVYSVSRQNVGWVDFGWTLSIAILAIFFQEALGDRGPKGIWLSAMVLVWAARLAGHLFIRLSADPAEEARYAKIRADWKTCQNFKFFWMFQFQAAVAAVLSIPFLITHSGPGAGLGPWQIMASGFWFAGFIGVALADHQLKAFKADAANKGKVCRIGLWGYSRHPNYFFEWLIWVSYALYAFDAPGGWAASVSPFVMLVFLLKVSGVPPAEAQSLRSRGEAYRDYQKSTSVFIPWFKKKSGGKSR